MDDSHGVPMDGPGYTSSSSGYSNLTLDTTGFMDTADQLGSASSSSGSLSAHLYKKERDGSGIQAPNVMPGSSSNRSLMSSNSTTGSNLTDFTKRKNWSQRIIEELKDFLHVLSPAGKVMYCSPSSLELVGYAPEELVGRIITEFIHVDDIDMFIREFNMSIHTRKEFKLYYRFRKKDDKFIIFEVTGHPYFGDGSSVSAIPKCFFGMAQPYPTKATGMLDSFLELKMENELLRRKLRTMRAQQQQERAEKASAQAAAQHASSAGGVSGQEQAQLGQSVLPIGEIGDDGDEEDLGMEGIPSGGVLDEHDNETELVDVNTNVAIQQSLAVYAAGVRSSTNLQDSVEILTGLRFQDGERSQGISRGLPSASLMNDSIMDMDEQTSIMLGSGGVGIGGVGIGSGVGMGLPTVGDLPSALKPVPSRSQDTVTVVGPSNVLGSGQGASSGGGGGEEKAKPRKKMESLGSRVCTCIGVCACNYLHFDHSLLNPVSKQKKPKMEDDEYVCTDCGTTESPEWRKGPMGPKTLCNACGLRWAKKNKKGGPAGNGGMVEVEGIDQD
ncbi:hypothetical protein BC936DRAFT_149796 [Jimgerdemannia flammicorona]|uniref:Uncharacterized protein n=1 Tax=Jimgerdemannia flammicorona TaxID=994334 RepID=A0A433D063_9FUNG|nr:hypothetical protein BC936DRAFT_149796 [Jimgerdemannia flammicorona]